ncbi:MAG: hypothetical protein HY723_03165 [Chloroflexi bacterium]|nr:hypothetical protein [Chloroflexota bacterium]
MSRLPDDRYRPSRRDPRAGLGGFVAKLASQLFGGTMETHVQPRHPSQEPPGPQSAVDAVGVLEQALSRFEAVLEDLEGRVRNATAAGVRAQLTEDELAGLKSTVAAVIERLEEAFRQLSAQYRGLSNEASRLTAVAEPLEARIKELAGTIELTGVEPASPAEPQFVPNGQALRVVLAAVPGFQGLMEAQRALSGLAAAEGASVVAYKNGEAALEVTLREPVTAREIVEGLSQVTGHQLLIEEARPEAARLRLRFVA